MVLLPEVKGLEQDFQSDLMKPSYSSFLSLHAFKHVCFSFFFFCNIKELIDIIVAFFGKVLSLKEILLFLDGVFHPRLDVGLWSERAAAENAPSKLTHSEDVQSRVSSSRRTCHCQFEMRTLT